MELLLVRHGQPAWVDQSGIARNDPGLTALGRAQALAAAAALGTTPIDEIIASTAVRAQQTAAPLAELLGLTVTSEEDLFELRMPPQWDGAPADEIGEWFRTSRRRNRHEWWQGAPGGEDFGDFHERVTRCVDRLLEEREIRRHSIDGNLWDVPEEDDRRLVFVTHAGTSSAALGHLLGIEPEPWEWERFNAAHASITRVRTTHIAGRAIWSLTTFADTAHLRQVTR